MNWSEWNTPGAGNRLTLLNGAGTILFMGYAYLSGDISFFQVQQIALTLLIYAVGMTAVVLLPFLRANIQRQAVYLTACMVSLTLVSTLLAGVSYLAIMLWFPALHASLRQTDRAALSTALLCAFLWLLLNHYQNPTEYLAWVGTALELLPAALLLWVIRGLHGEVADTRNRITALSFRDELTGLLNMRAFTRMMQSEHAKAAETAGKYSLLMIDIDHLQVYNDRYGHEQGNRVIVAVADAIKRSTRSDDYIARYGGDEFMVLLPGAGDDIAEVVANRIAQNVYNITLSFDRSMQRVSVNTGRAIFPESGSGIQEMMSFADRAMYQDKNFRRSVTERKKDVGLLKEQAGVEDWG